MDKRDPEEFAQVLGLHDDGRAGGLSTENIYEAFESLNFHLEYLGADTPSDDRLLYAEAFSARYFPSFVRSFLSFTDENLRSVYMACLQTITLEANTSLGRFARIYPQEACALYLETITMISDRSIGWDEPRMDSSGHHAFAVYLYLIVIIASLSNHLPLGTHFPSLEPTLSNGLRDFASRCCSDKVLQNPSGMRLIEALVGGETDPRRLAHENRVVGWHSCERRVAEFHVAAAEGRMMGESTCIEVGEGKEMMACSRNTKKPTGRGTRSFASSQRGERFAATQLTRDRSRLERLQVARAGGENEQEGRRPYNLIHPTVNSIADVHEPLYSHLELTARQLVH